MTLDGTKALEASRSEWIGEGDNKIEKTSVYKAVGDKKGLRGIALEP